MPSQSLLYCLGAMLFVHAGYLASESHQFGGNFVQKLDIIIETNLALLIVIAAAILSTRNPTLLTVNGKTDLETDTESPSSNIIVNDSFQFTDKYLLPIEMLEASAVLENLGAGPYTKYQTSIDTIDIIAKRLEYKNWIKLQRASTV